MMSQLQIALQSRRAKVSVAGPETVQQKSSSAEDAVPEPPAPEEESVVWD